MANEFSVQGETTLITGGASGLGAGFAERFLKEGAKRVAILDIAAEAGTATANKLNAEFGPGRALFCKCDVTDEKVLAATFQNVVKQFGNVDVVVNNAGILDDSPEVYRRANEVNWQALVTLSMLAWEHMRRDLGGAGGTIVNVSSIAALAQWPLLPIYSGAKAAVLHFSSCLGMEENYQRSGVRVLSISFGQTETPLMQNVERKCMDAAMGDRFAQREKGKKYQSVESAVTGLLTAVTRGVSGSAWLAARGEPAKDITLHLRAAYAEIAKAFPAS